MSNAACVSAETCYGGIALSRVRNEEMIIDDVDRGPAVYDHKVASWLMMQLVCQHVALVYRASTRVRAGAFLFRLVYKCLKHCMEELLRFKWYREQCIG